MPKTEACKLCILSKLDGVFKKNKNKNKVGQAQELNQCLRITKIHRTAGNHFNVDGYQDNVDPHASAQHVAEEAAYIQTLSNSTNTSACRRYCATSPNVLYSGLILQRSCHTLDKRACHLIYGVRFSCQCFH